VTANIVSIDTDAATICERSEDEAEGWRPPIAPEDRGVWSYDTSRVEGAWAGSLIDAADGYPTTLTVISSDGTFSQIDCATSTSARHTFLQYGGSDQYRVVGELEFGVIRVLANLRLAVSGDSLTMLDIEGLEAKTLLRLPTLERGCRFGESMRPVIAPEDQGVWSYDTSGIEGIWSTATTG